MANTAPYEVNATFSDDESFVFCLSFGMTDGTDFPFSDYEIEYSLREGGATRLLLSQGSGITVSGEVVMFDAGTRALRKGDYEHGCRIRSLADGRTIQVFTGSVRIGEGEF